MYSLGNQRFSVDVTTMHLTSTFISSAVTRLYISTIRTSPACSTYLNITLLRYTLTVIQIKLIVEFRVHFILRDR